MVAWPQRDGRLRGVAVAALMPAAAFAVHQLRYWLAFHGMAAATLQRQGHVYLHSLAPWIVLLLALSGGAFLRALGRALGGERSLARHGLSFLILWLLSAALLVLIYAGQELLEALFATGHPAGLAGVFGYGGWWAIPAALCVGLVLAAAFHGARWALRMAAAHASLTPRRPRGTLRAHPRAAPLRLAPAPVAAGWSDRGPPR